MSHPDRRRFLELSAAGLAAATGGLAPAVASAAEPVFKPEAGASLQLLRWSGFVKSDDAIWADHTKKFTAQFNVPVEIQSLNWPDVNPKAALAAQVNSGPDIIMGWNDDPFLYPDKLVDMTDIAESMGRAHGGLARSGPRVRIFRRSQALDHAADRRAGERDRVSQELDAASRLQRISQRLRTACSSSRRA